MEILYTEITQDLTEGLLEIALEELEKNRKVYYIVPSSMSFEKEKEILERLAKGSDTAVFDLLVTRFKQLPYYFDKREKATMKTELGTVGLSMLFRRVLRSFKKDEIPLYFSLQDSAGFLEMLIQLRAELLTANLSVENLPDNPKNQELKKILTTFEAELSVEYANYSEFGDFTNRLADGEFDQQLKDVTIIIDGYTRFSAEEELFIESIQEKVARFVVGTYSDENSLTAGSETIYVGTSQMITRFRNKFPVELRKIASSSVNEVYSKLTRMLDLDSRFVITDEKIELKAEDEKYFRIWEAENQKVEIERVAKEIRQKISQGAFFKDFTILVGDPAAYEITLKEIFDLYEIPFFYAQEESMSQHPLVIFFESLFAIKKNNYRTDDVVNLLKSKVYTDVNLDEEVIDYFEYYVQKYKISGRKKFTEEFIESEFSQIELVNEMREKLLGSESPLQVFLGNNRQKTGKKWVSDLQGLLENGNVMANMNAYFSAAELQNEHQMADKHEQVWQMLISTLNEFFAVFSDEKLKSVEFLDILLAGLKNAKYRQIPANVDVVNVKDYELVEPKTNKYIYAIGLSQTNFPRIKKNSTLLSDEERLEINQTTDENQFIEQLNVANYQKNQFTVLSLINSAKESLVLSMPQIMTNEQGEFSPVFQLFLKDADEKILQKIQGVNLFESLEHIGNSRSVIAMIGQIERELVESEETNEDKRVFWSSIFRILVKSNADFQKILLDLAKDIDTVNLAPDTLEQIYGDKIYASVSSFERFYNCEYQYFLENTLSLETFENIDINSKIVGNFFHEVFEKVMKETDLSAENFDEKLTLVLQEVDKNYSRYFTQDATARFTWSNLEEIVRQTATVLKATVSTDELKTLLTESSFGLPKSELGNFSVDDIYLRGRIDRLDQLSTDYLGAIDYKSSAHSFKLQEAYDGLSLQFMTYLDVIKQAFPNQKIWGALYLQFKNQPINLSEINQLSEIANILKESMRYDGLVLEDAAEQIKGIENIALKNTNIYNEEEFEQLLKLNEEHYRAAGQRLKNGKIAINPIMKRSEGIDQSGNVRGCRYCPLKSICRFEANIHMNEHSREIGQKSQAEILAELKGEGRDE
ncbi:MAG: ATP-dependent nuclease subunit B [Lactococcus cremoris]